MYAQDDWKATRKLTVNYGLRYDIFIPRYEKNDNLSSFDPTIPNPAAGGRLGALAFLGEGPDALDENHSPTPISKRSVRGLGWPTNSPTRPSCAAAMAFTTRKQCQCRLRDSLSTSSGFSANPTFQTTDQGVTPAFNWNTGFPQNYVKPPVISPSAANGADLRPILRDDGRPPYFQNWSFTIEREIVPRANIELTYLGTKGTRLGSGLVRLNELDPKYLSLGTLLSRPFNSPEAIAAGIVSPYTGFTGSVAQALRPYPQYLNLDNRSNPSGSSTYHAFQTQVSIRALAGLDVQMAYTFAKDNIGCGHPCRRRSRGPNYIQPSFGEGHRDHRRPARVRTEL